MSDYAYFKKGTKVRYEGQECEVYITAHNSASVCVRVPNPTGRGHFFDWVPGHKLEVLSRPDNNKFIPPPTAFVTKEELDRRKAEAKEVRESEQPDEIDLETT